MNHSDDVIERTRNCASFILGQWGEVPSLVLVLGSGWESMLDVLETRATLDFSDIPYFESTSVPGHAGELRLCSTGSNELVVQSGRLHLYEGHGPMEVTFPLWVYGELGVRIVVMFSAAGALNPTYMTGDCVLVADHINLTGENPLSGIESEEGGYAFLSGQGYYSPGLLDAAEGWGRFMGRELPRAVYVGVSGPTFETPAEASYMRLLGGDVVGMSTVLETLVARYVGIEVLATCAVTNVLLPAGLRGEVTHHSVLDAVGTVAGDLGEHLESLISRVSAAG